MDAQYSFASREDIWRVHEEVKDLYATQLEHGERISKLERRRDEDARMKSLWGPFSPFPSAISNPQGRSITTMLATQIANRVHSRQESAFNSPAEPFKGFDQGQQHNLPSNLALESEEEPKRGASRANSVRFDESSMQGYYNHANRSVPEITPLRTGSGLGSHPLTERSLSHRSDGNKSSSGHSHRTFSLGLDTTRADGSTTATTVTPPPGLPMLGPVPCIIRCWLTAHFSNDSLLYAAVCSGSYSSAISHRMVRKLGLEGDITEKDGVRNIKLPVYLPEASVYQSSSRAGNTAPHLPVVTVQFTIRDTDGVDDMTIQIFLGSDVLRGHNADILFSQDKMLIVDDGLNRISVPLVRPEKYEAFKTLSTGPQSHSTSIHSITDNGSAHSVSAPEQNDTRATSKPGSPVPRKSRFNLPLPTSSDSIDSQPRRSAHFEENPEDHSPDRVHSKSTPGEKSLERSSKTEGTGVWGSWRREQPIHKSEPGPYLAAYQRNVRTRNMKVLRPSKPLSSSSRQVSGTPASADVEPSTPRSLDLGHRGEHGEDLHAKSDSLWNNKTRSSNPVGGASAFGWLNTAQSKPSASGSD
ncbi:hypothetical protein PRK78_003280 [Emydomyces testavorans]|uniref:Ubiquitin carboxyl-terminal hydrolase 19 n=1 Tax=Emydomyces testavorans TaxID=2070801 RepID=A0AAF0DGI4_9EURO|nr:hypothetical protein PRK78_003280 [Emydomyces testavorans]